MMDTNVLVAAVRSPDGASREILNLVSGGYVTPVVSVPLFVEYESVMKRVDFLEETGLEVGDVDAILDHVLACAELQKIYFLWRPLLPDPKDDCVLECAVNGAAGALITFNTKDFLVAKDSFDVVFSTPSDFLALGTEE